MPNAISIEASPNCVIAASGLLVGRTSKLTALPGEKSQHKHPDYMPKKKTSKTDSAPAVDRAAPCSSAVLTVDILKSLKFWLHLHLNGGDEFSKRVETNDEWGVAGITETHGPPGHLITAKEIYMMANHDVVMDMRKKPWDLEGFVAAYNASRANVSDQATARRKP